MSCLNFSGLSPYWKDSLGKTKGPHNIAEEWLQKLPYPSQLFYPPQGAIFFTSNLLRISPTTFLPSLPHSDLDIRAGGYPSLFASDKWSLTQESLYHGKLYLFFLSFFNSYPIFTASRSSDTTGLIFCSATIDYHGYLPETLETQSILSSMEFFQSSSNLIMTMAICIKKSIKWLDH